jgi:hypothetical protein
MKIQDHLDILFKTSQRIKIGKAIIIGDLHLGVRDNADDFDGHDMVLINSIFPYIHKGYSLLLGGDITDDWENSDRSKIKAKYLEVFQLLNLASYKIPGNHDPDPSLPLAYVLVLESGKGSAPASGSEEPLARREGLLPRREILWTHGHIGDFFNSQASWLGKFFVRHVWRNLQMIGIFKDPTTATTRNPNKHEATRIAFLDWAKTRKIEVIYQHTHFAIEGPSWNGGSWVGNGGQGIEIVGDQITLKRF